MRSNQVKDIHSIQELTKKDKNEKLDKNLNDKFEKRVFETKQKRMQANEEIENLELMEEALMEQLSRTTQKRDEKMQIIRDINSGTKNISN